MTSKPPTNSHRSWFPYATLALRCFAYAKRFHPNPCPSSIVSMTRPNLRIAYNGIQGPGDFLSTGLPWLHTLGTNVDWLRRVQVDFGLL